MRIIESVGPARLSSTSINVANWQLLLIIVLIILLIIGVKKRCHCAANIEIRRILLTQNVAVILLVQMLVHGMVLRVARVLILAARSPNISTYEIRRVH